MVLIHRHVRFVLPHAPIRYRLTDPHSLVLYIIYFPPHLKYVTLDIDADESRPSERVRTDIKSDTWRLSVILSWIVAIHLSVLHWCKAGRCPLTRI